MAGWAAGVFTRARNWVTDKNGAINPQAALFDQEDDNFAAGLNNCVTKDGLNKPSAAMDWNGQNLTNVAALAYTGSITGRGTALCKVKSVDTTRNTTTTLTDDTHLSGIALAASSYYAIEALIDFYAVTAPLMGAKWNLYYSGTQLISNAFTEGNVVGPNILTSGVASVSGTAGISIASAPNTVGGGLQRIFAFLATNGAGSLSIQWAQNSSNANNLVFRQGSYLRVMQVS
jgi:hypothetical protein